MAPLQIVPLCRIAKKAESEDPTADDLIILFREEVFIGESFLRDRWDEFVSLIEAIEKDGCQDVKVQTDSSGQFLEIAATCWTFKTRAPKRTKWFEKIFPFLFSDNADEIGIKVYEQDEIENVEEFIMASTQSGRAYMTNTIYNSLYDCHMKNRNSYWQEDAKLNLPDSFIPKLCTFQESTIHWLLQRERVQSKLPAMYRKYEAKDGIHSIYKHRWCFNLDPDFRGEEFFELPPGGILADEMGMGKTVETLALILLNPRANLKNQSFLDEIPVKKPKICKKVFCICGINEGKKVVKCSKCNTKQHIKCVRKHEKPNMSIEPYFCPSCWEKYCEDDLIETGATFIVSPNVIKTQWVSEIHRHVYPNKKVFVYEGLMTNHWVSPLQLASYDIVITDYNVIRKEFFYSGANRSDRVTRNESRKMNLKSPLLMLNWWRVCLDEAQMVESNTAQVATLARMLTGVNRWAITGTPIQQSMDDLLPLFRFIGIPEFGEPIDAWNTLVYDFIRNYKKKDIPSPLIEKVLSTCMWRTCKSAVEEELEIPEQITKVHRIDFSLIEKIYYEDLHSECRATFDDSIRLHIPWKTEEFDSKTISPKILKLILMPLLRLRQCCSISVVQSNSNVPMRQFLQPKELHAHLKNSNENDCKSALRTIASCLNGMAGLFILSEEYEQAIREYKNVLQLVDKYSEYSLSIDTLLQIHALHNMIEVNIKAGGTLIPADVIETHQKKLDALEWKYVEPYVQKLQAAKISYEQHVAEVTALEAATECNVLESLELICATLLCSDVETQKHIFNRTITETLKQYAAYEIPQNLRDVMNLIQKLCDWSMDMWNTRRALLDAFENLKFFTEELKVRTEIPEDTLSQLTHFVSSVYVCHLHESREDSIRGANDNFLNRLKRNALRRRDVCLLCTLRRKLLKFECQLLNKTYIDSTEQAEGLDSASLNICLLKGLVASFKNRLGANNPHIVRELDANVKLLDMYQILSKKMLKLWIEIEYTVKSYDELDMCKMRISLRRNENDTSYYRINLDDIQKEYNMHCCNLQAAEEEFSVKFARLKYILNSQLCIGDTFCPICTSDDNLEFAVLECGHFTCVECYQASCNFAVQNKISCSVCRNKQSRSTINLLTRKKITEDLTTGEYSAKIAGIVRVIWELQKEEKPKILIFSEWEPILRAMGTALEGSNIKYYLYRTPQDIVRFKNPRSKITCLLMPYQKGSKGINLIEATHVFLVEPILNPAEELQAIGRVHRIGQTKTTTVHRFIVNNTIEEKIFNMVFQSSSDSKWDFENITVSQMKSLFELETPSD